MVDRLFGGTTQLAVAFQPLMKAAERTLDLDADKRARTILRVDAGGGSVEDVNWALQQGYQFHGKDYSGTRAQALAESVTEWINDPRVPERQVGWVTQEATEYVRPVKRIAVRCRKKNGQWGIGVLISTLSAQDVILLTQQPIDQVNDPHKVLLAYVYFYDQRGGGVETANREDKQGLGLAKRNKKHFEAQQMLIQLGALAHNVIVWARRWLAPHFPKVADLGILRMVRDVFHLSGFVVTDPFGHITQIVLNRLDPLANGLTAGLLALLAPEQVTVTLGLSANKLLPQGAWSVETRLTLRQVVGEGRFLTNFRWQREICRKSTAGQEAAQPTGGGLRDAIPEAGGNGWQDGRHIRENGSGQQGQFRQTLAGFLREDESAVGADHLLGGQGELLDWPRSR